MFRRSLHLQRITSTRKTVAWSEEVFCRTKPIIRSNIQDVTHLSQCMLAGGLDDSKESKRYVSFYVNSQILNEQNIEYTRMSENVTIPDFCFFFMDIDFWRNNGKDSMCESAVSYKFNAFDEKYAFDDDGLFTYSSTEQKRVEELTREQARKFIDAYLDSVDDDSEYSPALCRALHTRYVCRSLKQLGKSNSQLDASRPWFCYWGMHSLRLLEASLDESLTSSIVRFLKTCEWPTGGYGGGPGQYPHLATTYGAVMALISIGTDEALASINRKTLKDFLLSVKQPDGGFALQIGGEVDIRGAYCALSVASITNILDDRLRKDADSWVISCQTYEGGFGGERCCEAHGGYTFCGVATLMLLGKSALIHASSLYKWLAQKQMKFEGGFQGRTNKLVDGCYSFWQAAVFPMLEVTQRATGNNFSLSFDAKALQEFILIACQDNENGGLRDKADKGSDLYHTCYVLSGLSVAQYYASDGIVGGEINRLARLSPVYNICENAERKAREYFGKLNDLTRN